MCFCNLTACVARSQPGQKQKSIRPSSYDVSEAFAFAGPDLRSDAKFIAAASKVTSSSSILHSPASLSRVRKKGSFGKGVFSEKSISRVLENLEVPEILENRPTVENKGESDHSLKSLKITSTSTERQKT